MKNLVLVLTLIFSMHGLVNAGTHNTTWVLIMSETLLFLSPASISSNVFQSIGDYPKGTLTETECYEELKKDALRRNKMKGLFQGESKFRIEIVDDLIVSAKARYMNVHYELHCLEITLD